MTDESYRKCRTCRFCLHSDGIWLCMPSHDPVESDHGCPRYRPGCCESCSYFDSGFCSKRDSEVFPLDVCSDYDPHSAL